MKITEGIDAFYEEKDWDNLNKFTGALTNTNFALFMYLMFSINMIEVYIAAEEYFEIKRRIFRVYSLAILFAVFYLFVMSLRVFVHFSDDYRFFTDKDYPVKWPALIGSITTLVITLLAQLFFFFAGLRLLKLFRKYGHIENDDHSGEVFLVICNILFLIDISFNLGYLPVTYFHISREKNYLCSPFHAYTPSGMATATHLIRPLSFQMMFVGTVWMLARIQRSSHRQLNE